MIRIHNAPSKVPKLHYTGPWAFGPFDQDGKDIFETTSFRSSFDSLKERPGLFGDNHVNHREVHADLYLDPWFENNLDPMALIRSPLVLPSGKLSSRYSNIRGYYLSPASSWIPTGSKGKSFFKKLNPRTMMVLTLTTNYTNRTNKVTRIDLRIERCPELNRDDENFELISEYYSTPYGVPINPEFTFKDLSNEAVLPHVQHLASIAQGFEPTTMVQGTLTFPYHPSIQPLGNDSSIRRVYTPVSWITEERHDLPEIKSFGELAGEAIDTLDTNSINMFEFLQGFKRPLDLVPKLKNLSKLKTHAGNYLGVQYGVLPTVGDLSTLKEAILGSARPYFDSNNFQVLTAGHRASRNGPRGLVEVTNRIKICINPTDPVLSSISEKLRDIGGFPSIDNLWELVPYSFVIDWFVNVGDWLEGIDDRFRLSKLPVMFATTSSKIVITPDRSESLKEFGAYGEISIVYYDRSVSSKAPTPPLKFEVSNELPNHWLEAAALIVTARK